MGFISVRMLWKSIFWSQIWLERTSIAFILTHSYRLYFFRTLHRLLFHHGNVFEKINFYNRVERTPPPRVFIEICRISCMYKRQDTGRTPLFMLDMSPRNRKPFHNIFYVSSKVNLQVVFWSSVGSFSFCRIFGTLLCVSFSTHLK